MKTHGRTPDWRCVDCGRFVSYEDHDRGSTYCTCYCDWPHEDQVWCRPCADKQYQRALKDGERMRNYYGKPDFQVRAMRELGLVEKHYRLVREDSA